MKRELYKIWKRYINKPIYRIIPERDYKIILKKGLDPKKDPYEKIRPKLNKLFKIILNLEKKGKMIKLKWGSKEVYGSYIVKTTKDDLLKYYIDFTPNKKDIKYYSMMVGGAIVNNIKRLTKKLIETNIEISNKNLKIINELNRWAKSKKCENKVIYIYGNSKIFKTALFQKIKITKIKTISGKKKRYYLKSPFGDFEHFKRVIKKEGIKKYMPYLKTGNFYLRVKERIPASEIGKLK